MPTIFGYDWKNIQAQQQGRPLRQPAAAYDKSAHIVFWYEDGVLKGRIGNRIAGFGNFKTPMQTMQDGVTWALQNGAETFEILGD